MTTFCKTSQGGFNLEMVTDWKVCPTGDVTIMLAAQDDENRMQSCFILDGVEASRIREILDGLCIFDITQERVK